MPELTNNEIQTAIDLENLTMLSVDTSIFDQYQCGLEHGLLGRLAQFADANITLVLSDVVIKEVQTHMLGSIHDGDKLLQKSVKASGSARNLGREERQAVMDGILLNETAEGCMQRRWDEFQNQTNLQVADTAKLVSSGNLFAAYFGCQPPFENKETKKYEFPDAMALQALDAYAKQAEKLMLVVSADGGWRGYCKTSDWLVCERELGAALASFQKLPSVICAKMSIRLASGELTDVVNSISEELERYVEGAYFYVEASAAYYYEDEIYEQSFLDFAFSRVPEFELIDQDEEAETYWFEAAIGVEVSASCGFSFSISDEGDQIGLGGADVSIDRTLDFRIMVTVSGNPEGEHDVVEIEVVKADTTLDFGEVGPDYGEEYYEE